jgi:hypothetical protein
MQSRQLGPGGLEQLTIARRDRDPIIEHGLEGFARRMIHDQQ